MDKHADTLVRRLLIEEKRRASPERLPEIVPQEEVPDYDPEATVPPRESAQESIAQILKAERMAAAPGTRKARRGLRLPRVSLPSLPSLPKRRARRVPTRVRTVDVAPAQPEAPAVKAGTGASAARRLPGWLTGYRPTRKHVAWAAVAAVMLYRPLLLPLVALLLFWVVLIAYLTVGPDRWGEILGGAWQRLRVRRPALAERVRLRADRFAERFDRVLDWLPESWADRLALPDFSQSAEPDEDAPDPFDRLAAEARQV